jgi:uncharacterized protein with FMN-binding domain
MRKIKSIGITVTVLMLFSACGTRNVGIGNRNDGRNNDTTNQLNQAGMQDSNNNVTDGTTNLRGSTGINNNAIAGYKDGTYMGFGNGNAEGVERAIVTIRNGRIADIDLTTVGQQESTTSQNPEEADINGNNGIGSGTRAGTGNEAINPYGTGVAAGPNNNVGTTGTGAGNTVGDAVNGVKTSLINAMIQSQNTNVDINDNGTNAGNRITNWKLAVTRALEQARR